MRVDTATDTARYYVHTGSRAVAMVERVSGANTTQYLHRDQQGSVTKVTSSGGSVTQALAYDAWGLRRNAADWSPLASPFAGSHETERGYTGHEHLDNVGLIHMNGRVQDPKLGRFVSADPFVAAPFNTQSHNRYSYVWNNPASMVDPSGFFPQWLCLWICGGGPSDDIGEDEDDDLCDATCMNDRAIVNWHIEETERIADQRYLEELQGGVPNWGAPQGVGFWGRVGAGLGAVGSGAEAILGGVACSTTGLGCVIGVPAMLHGADNFQADFRTMWTGERVDSYSVRGLRAVGVPGAEYINAGAGIVLSGGSGLAGTAARGSSLAAREIKLVDGFYTAEGSAFKFSKAYYEKLWATGRGAPFLQADEVVRTATSITLDPAGKAGFFRYANEVTEMIYNPVTREVWHLMPIE